jgi:DNA-binding LacI/PurR family transcriptional regulator
MQLRRGILSTLGKTTIKDIATRVGVGSTTVSAVLSPEASRHVRVSEGTRRRIQAAAQEMNYRPNRAARSLRSRRDPNVIGLSMKSGYLDPHFSFTMQIICGLHSGCYRHQKHLLLHGDYERQSVDDLFTELTDAHLDGLVLLTSPADPLADLLASSTLPVVAVVDPQPKMPSVLVEDVAGSHLLAAHIAAKGHHHVIYVSGSQPHAACHRRQEPLADVSPGEWSLVSTVERRYWAFQEAAKQHGMLLTGCHSSGPREHLTASDLDWLDLPRSQRPTVAVCWNDAAAYAVLEECQRRGLHVPQDIAVAGFDGLAPAAPTPYHLTTIRAPWEEVARTAVDQLISLLEGKTLPLETLLPVQLFSGDTT